MAVNVPSLKNGRVDMCECVSCTMYMYTSVSDILLDVLKVTK